MHSNIGISAAICAEKSCFKIRSNYKSVTRRNKSSISSNNNNGNNNNNNSNSNSMK